ncbi:MAG TPA: hypothetical protein VJB82_02770 [Candidatus Peribacterales bacterium]|nr:hypothetical protein [Candidatus Peribacterales bacterium]
MNKSLVSTDVADITPQPTVDHSADQNTQTPPPATKVQEDVTERIDDVAQSANRRRREVGFTKWL